MDHGIKVTKPNGPRTATEAHLLSALAVPYLNGAYLQVMRYRQATTNLQLHAIDGTNDCLHEVSCLFEDLATIAVYIEMCGVERPQHQLIKDIRNVIRHDIRDGLFKEESWKRDQAAKRLGVPRGLIVNMGFDKTAVKVGEKTITLRSLMLYLSWARKVIETNIKSGMKQGYIKPSQDETGV